MPEPRRTTCLDCPAEVIFVFNVKSGARMILDADPLPEPVELESRLVGVVGNKGQILTKDRIADDGSLIPDPGYAPSPELRWHRDHHATCPNAGQWKGRTRADRVQ